MNAPPNHLPTYLTQAETRAFFAVISSVRDRALFGVVYGYGLRAGEVALLNRDDVDLSRSRIRIRRLKGGIPGERPMFRNLCALVGRYLENRRDHQQALFVGRQGRLGKRRIQQLFGLYAAKAGLPANHRHVHVLRHSVAVHVLDAGEEIDFARDHLGHRAIQSTLIYAQVSSRRRTRAMRRLEKSADFPLPS
jgi:integrase